MQLDIPYFMSNKDWYYFDPKDLMYKLTDQATDKAIESYNQFYKDLSGGRP